MIPRPSIAEKIARVSTEKILILNILFNLFAIYNKIWFLNKPRVFTTRFARDAEHTEKSRD